MPCVRQRWCFLLIISRPLNLYLSAYLYIYYRWVVCNLLICSKMAKKNTFLDKIYHTAECTQATWPSSWSSCRKYFRDLLLYHLDPDIKNLEITNQLFFMYSENQNTPEQKDDLDSHYGFKQFNEFGKQELSSVSRPISLDK